MSPFHQRPLQAICDSQLNNMHFLRRIRLVKLLSRGIIFFRQCIFRASFFPYLMQLPYFRVKSELPLFTVYCTVIWSLVAGLDGSCYSAICTSSVSFGNLDFPAPFLGLEQSAPLISLLVS